MSLQEKINNDAVSAFKNGDRFITETLRSLKAAILNQAIALKLHDVGLSDNQVETLIAREVKKRQESADIYESADRPELALREHQEIEVLKVYLPTQLTELEINQLIEDIVDEQGMEKIVQNMGKIIGAVKQKAGAKADGAVVSRLVQKFLQN